jgi:hypothetical protein
MEAYRGSPTGNKETGSGSAFVTLFTKAEGSLSKRIELKDGAPVSDGSQCKMSEGSAQVVRAPNASSLAEYINAASSSMALALGTLKGAPVGESVPIVAKVRLNGPGVFARSLEYMAFEQGREAWGLFDFDRKGMPAAVAERLRAVGGFEAALARVLPQIPKTARVIRPSTSSGLINAVTGERYAGTGGAHLYPLVEDGTDIRRFVTNLFERLWLAGFGWVTVSACGALLVRSIVDVSVASPERLIFEGAPTLGPGLEQDVAARTALAFEGDPLATKKACSDLTAGEQAELRMLIDTAKAEKAREARIVRERWIDETAPRIADKTGKPLEIVRRELGNSFAGYLFPDFPLEFDDSGEGRVDDILADPERFIGATLRDPHEPSTQGRNCAIVQRRRDGRLTIFSFAHGRMRYLLAYDFASLLVLIKQTPADTLPDVFMNALPYASLSATEEMKVHNAAREKSGWTKGDWSKLATKKLGPKGQRPGIDPRPISDQIPERPWLDEPYDDAELNVTLTPLDWLLCKVKTLEPPFRDLDGYFTIVTERPLPKTHQLSSSEPTPEENRLPPPPTIRLIQADRFQILSAIEPHVEYRVETENGYRSVRLPGFFVDAYARWKLSGLPRVEAVLTLPIVWQGELIGKTGLDRDQQVIFRIDERLTELLPKKRVLLEVAKKSYESLRDEWLKDVAFKDRDKDAVKAIAIALTIIERSLPDARPQFTVTGDLAGGGKTTLINMLVAAVTGHPAAASAWTDDEEERKKAIFAICLAGIPAIVFDNIKRGTVIDCPHLAKLATATEINDRVLGESRNADAPAKTVIIYNGNSISSGGDLTSRNLRINIESQSADPAERKFAHEDPIAWTIDNRITILTHLFNILMLEHNKPNRAKTRFKTWWRLIGYPLELVTGFNFGSEIRDNTDEDDETVARARILARLWAEFGKEPTLFQGDTLQSATFLAKDVAKLLPIADDPNQNDKDVELAADLATVAQRKFAHSPAGVAKVRKDHVRGWVNLADGSTARLVSDVDRDTKMLTFYVERRQPRAG